MIHLEVNREICNDALEEHYHDINACYWAVFTVISQSILFFTGRSD